MNAIEELFEKWWQDIASKEWVDNAPKMKELARLAFTAGVSKCWNACYGSDA